VTTTVASVTSNKFPARAPGHPSVVGVRTRRSSRHAGCDKEEGSDNFSSGEIHLGVKIGRLVVE
jgi:hypothetical protein